MRDDIITTVAMTAGIINTLYGLCRDKLGFVLESGEDGALGNGVSRAIRGLNDVVCAYDELCKQYEEKCAQCAALEDKLRSGEDE